MGLVAYGAQDIYLFHSHRCYICTGKRCCEETTEFFYCNKHLDQCNLELNLCCHEQLPSELTDILLKEMKKLIDTQNVDCPHECYVCTGERCCLETIEFFYCKKHMEQCNLELNLCWHDQLPPELTDILIQEIAELISPLL